jgi:SAM-dependent methyltransferase
MERRLPWDLGGPAPPLVRAVRKAGLPRGAKTAVLGAGRGHDALAIARLGFDVVGFDFSFLAVAAARALAESSGNPARFEQQDIFDLPAIAAGAYQVVVEHTCFCAIHPDRRAAFVQAAAALLEPQGLLIGLFFPIDAERQGGPPYAISVDELDRLFSSSFEILRSEEPSDSAPERRGLERLVVMRRRP